MDTPPNPAFAQIQDTPALPRVLLLGDSISIGYTVTVRDLLAGKANVHRPPENCRESAFGLQRLAVWLGDKKWDVIHFNFGLHDLKYVDESGTLSDPSKGRQVASLQMYEQNLRRLVAELKKTGAHLIWCATTPVPDGAAGRTDVDAKKYNAVAAKIMAEQNVPTNDLWTVVKNSDPALQLPRDVHFTPQGYAHLGRAVAGEIQAALSRAKK